jgi:hypothetical protein
VTNFHRNTNSDKGATRVTHEAKRSSAANHDGSGLLGSVLGRRALATRGALGRSEGTGAPSSRRAHATLALLAISLIALFATAAPAPATAAFTA